MHISGNVPDDWNHYWRECRFCGQRYHASEGGCDCLSDLECSCGERDWERDQWGEPPGDPGPVEHTLRCRKCHTGPAVETINRTSTHVARKPHEGSNGEIRVGDRYRRTVVGGYYPSGPRWMATSKTRTEKGESWEDTPTP